MHEMRVFEDYLFQPNYRLWDRSITVFSINEVQYCNAWCITMGLYRVFFIMYRVCFLNKSLNTHLNSISFYIYNLEYMFLY